MEENNLEYLSGEAKEILAQRPSWVTTWALAGILCVLFLLVLAGALFSYSEIVDGKFLLTTEEPPVSVQVPKTGYLDRLLVSEGAKVEEGEMLAVFASDAGVGDVLTLEGQMKGMENANIEMLRNFQPDPSLQLGELAGGFDKFLSILQYIPVTGIAPADQSAIYAMRQTNAQLQRSINAIEVENDLKQNELAALKKQFVNANEMYKKTLDEKYSAIVLEIIAKQKKIEAEISANDSRIQRILDQIQENNVSIVQATGQSSQNIDNKLFQLKQSAITLQNDIRRWKSAHLVTAPATGKVSFFNELSPNQLLKKDEVMLAIIPQSAEEKYVGFANIPIEGSGRVKDGQEVKIKFLRYPFQQFGVVKGVVKKIFPLPKGDAYSVQVELVDGLKTSKGQTIEFHQQMTGKAEIVTDKKLFVLKLFETMF